MYRLVLVAAAALAGCAQSADDRPLTVEYISQAILAPSCSQYVCHSSYRMEQGYAFDTVDRARASLRRIVAPNDSEASLLYNVLVRKEKRMPYDAPLAERDIELIQRWIEAGAPGLEAGR